MKAPLVNSMDMQIRFLWYIQFLSLVGQAQSYEAFVITSADDEAPVAELVCEWKSRTWLSDLDGHIPLPQESIDSLWIRSMVYGDTLLSVRSGDTIELQSRTISLNEVVVHDRRDIRDIRHRRSRYELQREPADYRLLGYYADGPVKLDSLTIRVEEVLRSTTRIRVAIFQDGVFIYQSDPYPLSTALSSEDVTFPIHFDDFVEGEMYVGIQFLEQGKESWQSRSRHYQYRRGGTYTHRNTGVTLGSIRLKPGERMLHISILESARWITFYRCTDIRYTALYVKLHYFGPGELFTEFEEEP